MLKEYQKQFIEFIIHEKALSFGEFTLKSGRISPYFFNAGSFNSGRALAALSKFYADAFIANFQHEHFDLLFGPAYKGIPLVSTLCTALYEYYGLDLPYSFNRKEAKDHGEGGKIVGAQLNGKVLLVDDVITAGTTIRETLNLFANSPATISAILIAIDRQELASDGSSIPAYLQNLGIKFASIIKLSDIIEYMKPLAEYEKICANIIEYHKKYGVDI